MKILHIASGDLWAGAEVQIFTLLSELVKQHHVKAIVLNQGRLATELEAVGVKVHVLPESTLTFFQLYFEIRKIIAHSDPDIIHTHRQKEHVLGSFAGILNGHSKGFRTVHGSSEFSFNWKQKLQRFFDLFTARYLQFGVISVSETLTEELSQHIPQRKIKTIMNGIDPDTIKRDAQLKLAPLPADCIHIGLAGRMVHVKRVDLFLQTAKLLLNEHQADNYHFHVFGDGPLLNEYKNLANQLAIDQQVTFYGHCDDIRARISQMHIMMMTSDHEGLPMTALETLALDKPLVAHAVGGLKPLLSEAWQWGLVKDHCPTGYHNATVATLDAIRAGRSTEFPARFTAQQNADAIVKFYLQAITA